MHFIREQLPSGHRHLPRKGRQQRLPRRPRLRAQCRRKGTRQTRGRQPPALLPQLPPSGRLPLPQQLPLREHPGNHLPAKVLTATLSNLLRWKSSGNPVLRLLHLLELAESFLPAGVDSSPPHMGTTAHAKCAGRVQRLANGSASALATAVRN